MFKPTARKFLANSSPLRRSLNFRSLRFASTAAPKKAGGNHFWGFTGLFLIGALCGAGFVSFRIAKNPPTFLFPESSTTKLTDIPPPKYGPSAPVIKELKEKLKADQVSETENSLEQHSDSFFQTVHPKPGEIPDAVVYAESTEDVSLVLKLCHKYHVPVVPYTGGTSLEGHCNPTRHGICLDLSRMNKILKLHKDDLDVVVQPAVGWEDLRDYLNDYNLLFGPDPGPGACIGGMVGTSCSGTNAARYGTMKENVISLTVVLADGTVVKTKRRPRKSAAGYNLNGIFIGSEGTLGVVTEATLKLNVKPKYQDVAVVSFPSITNAADAVADFVSGGLQLDAMELLDDRMMHFVNDSGETSMTYDEAPTLMLKIGGNSKAGLKSSVATVKDICAKHADKTFKFAESEEEKYELWNARKVALWSTISYGQNHIDKNIHLWTTDVAVPMSNLSKCLDETKKDVEATGLETSIVGHVGDGNYHCFLLFKDEEHDKAAAAVERMVTRALKMEGTVTGEHGVGYGKKGYLRQEVNPETIDTMRKIKMALDPYRILNPDKIFDIDPTDEIIQKAKGSA